jgi:ribosomal protein L22
VRVAATAKYLRGSTRKARLITEAIKGKPVEEAAAILRFMPQAAARDVARVLESATANAENNLSPRPMTCTSPMRLRTRARRSSGGAPGPRVGRSRSTSP